MIEEHFCIMQPKNFGIICNEPINCEKCGWNPVVAEKRKKERITKEEKEN